MSLMTIRCAVRPTSRCGLSAVLLVLATAVVGAASAHGATVNVRPDPGYPGVQAVTFVAAAGENNRVVVRLLRLNRVTLAREWTVSDQGAELASGPGCTAVDPHIARCAQSGVLPLARVELGDLDDHLSTAPAGRDDIGYQFVVAHGGPGDDRLEGGQGTDDFAGGGGRDELLGGKGADSFFDGDRDGAAGERAPGPDVIDGGPGRDHVSYLARTAPVFVDLADPSPDGADGEGDTLVRIEDVTGGDGDDRIAGDDGANELDGGEGGRDRLAGRGGNDRLAFADRVSCGDGSDVLKHYPDRAAQRRPVTRDCEKYSPEYGLTLRIHPSRPRSGVLRWRIQCPLTAVTVGRKACSGTIRVREAAGRRRLLGAASFPRGRWRRRAADVVLTRLGRRLANRPSGVLATITVAGRGIRTPLRWTIRLQLG